jgi:hypothetical protein
MSPWVRVDDHLDDDPRVVTVGPAGAGLLILLLVYSNKMLTDGFAAEAVVRQKSIGLPNADEVLDGMIGVGLLRKSERDGITGFQIADDLVRLQPSRASVLADREAAKQRKERFKQRQIALVGIPHERKRNAKGTV